MDSNSVPDSGPEFGTEFRPPLTKKHNGGRNPVPNSGPESGIKFGTAPRNQFSENPETFFEIAVVPRTKTKQSSGFHSYAIISAPN